MLTPNPVSPQTRVFLQAAVVAALGLVAAKALIQLVLELTFQFHAPIGGDASVYLAVGRGILNGLAPYRDLFEIKPPGMFWLAGLSLALGGDERLAVFLQVVVLAAVPLLLVAVSLHRLRRQGW